MQFSITRSLSSPFSAFSINLLISHISVQVLLPKVKLPKVKLPKVSLTPSNLGQVALQYTLLGLCSSR